VPGLVETLTGLRARSERSSEAQRRSTAAASQELRSPLPRLRAEMEVTLRRPRGVAEHEETLRSCLEEVDRLQKLIEQLLELARLDASQDPEPAGPIAVDEIIASAAAASTP